MGQKNSSLYPCRMTRKMRFSFARKDWIVIQLILNFSKYLHAWCEIGFFNSSCSVQLKPYTSYCIIIRITFNFVDLQEK